jgi:hypothetical protein
LVIAGGDGAVDLEVAEHALDAVDRRQFVHAA